MLSLFKLLVAGGSVATVLSVIPFIFTFFVAPVEFNQFLIQKERMKHGVVTTEEISDTLRSGFAAGVNFMKQASKPQPNFDNKKEVFSYIFSMLPEYAVVYPTEGFYYWNMNHKTKGPVSGNVRLADLEEGKLSYAYFTVEPRETKQLHMGEIFVEDGLEIEKIRHAEYNVSYEGKTVRVKMPIEEVKPYFDLLPEEEFIGRIHDESAIKLFLIYNNKTESFYEVLDEQDGLTEELHAMRDDIYI